MMESRKASYLKVIAATTKPPARPDKPAESMHPVQPAQPVQTNQVEHHAKPVQPVQPVVQSNHKALSTRLLRSPSRMIKKLRSASPTNSNGGTNSNGINIITMSHSSVRRDIKLMYHEMKICIHLCRIN